MSIAAEFETKVRFNVRRPRQPAATGRIVCSILTIAALIPLAIAAVGIARGGLETYMVLAALALG